jgi:ABC-type transport system involved in cytochrome c biogenesis permease component
VARKDLRIEGRTKETFSATVLFALVGWSFGFASTRHHPPHDRRSPGLLWLTLAFSAIVGSRSFRLELRARLVAVALAPIDAARCSSGSGSQTSRCC